MIPAFLNTDWTFQVKKEKKTNISVSRCEESVHIRALHELGINLTIFITSQVLLQPNLPTLQTSLLI